MSGTNQARRTRNSRHRWWRVFHRTAVFSAMLFLVAEVAVVAVSSVRPSRAKAAPAPTGQGFTVTPGDLHFILKQIQIAEHHAATQTPDNLCGTLVGPGPNQIPDRLTSYGLRTVDGSCNNLFETPIADDPSSTRVHFGAADQAFPRLTTAKFRKGEDAGPFGPPGTGITDYGKVNTSVVDSQPRIISNLIVDQTSTNPAAVAAAEFPVRTQGNPGLFPCTTDPAPDGTGGVPANCVPSHKTLFIPNVTTDVGLSPPYNSMFTFFGQFFDHGVDQTVKSGASVFVPLKPDDPLITLGPDGKPNTGDEVTDPHLQFMVLTRAQNQAGPDGKVGTADDTQDATNTDSPWVDQSQTYTSHSSHQVFLREYVNNADGKPVSTGKLLGGLAAGQTYAGSPDGTTGMATWASVKKQAHDLLGLRLVDRDVTDIPMIAADPYGKFIPGPDRGLPQYVTASGTVEGRLDDPTTPDVDETIPVPDNVKHFDTPFLTDIAHNADPSPVDDDHNPATPPVAPTPDGDNTPSADFAHQPAGTYDDEMLNAHFAAGDGRVNENIALTTIHQIFHSEHDRLVDDIKNTLEHNTAVTATDLAAWQKVDVAGDGGYNYGERLFQAARFVTEMEYQHLVFEEFARKVQPAIRPFHVYSPDMNPAIPAEFAHAVYRFGHSMLDDDVARTEVSPTGAKTDNSLPLLTAFLNPPEYFHGKNGTLTPEQAAGSVVMGSSDQVGNELDEFVTETLRNNLLGLPLDLPTINMARAREAGVPPLNDVRRQIFAKTNDGAMAPYTDWSDFSQHLKHPESLINFVAAYGQHPTITGATTVAAKRAAAKAIVDPSSPPVTAQADIPSDAADFLFSTGAWANAGGKSITGLDDVDLWVGGLAEVTNLNGGLLGSTFNYVFQNTLEKLQDGDRLYYLNRTPGMNLRTQLEGNSFAEMIQRNTDGTNTLKADAFATADCKFQMSAIKPYSGAPTSSAAESPPLTPLTGAGAVDDDPGTDCDENQLLLLKPDGTVQYRLINKVDPSGINGQSVYKGTLGVNRIFGGNDNDTFWGDDGNDIIEGNNGDDVALGGDGNDILTDLNGADTQKGGPGNDAIDGGPGDDIPMGGTGHDFILGGANDNESFAGEGNDFVNAGQGADAVFGDGGDDWIQGGSGQDLLQGDHGAPFFDDPAETAPGNDVFVGQVGENDYDTEGGDDLMAQNAAIDRNAGAGGFDWAFHQYDTVGGDDDMAINNNLLGNPLPIVVNRDRWQETEADSGSAFNDVIRGDDDVPSTLGGAGFTGCDALDPAGVARIKGLDALVTTFPTPLSDVEAASATGVCPLDGDPATTAHDGNVWGDGNILLGGLGSDTITGRGADDIIDGDKALSVRIAVRTNRDDPATEIGSTDLMEGKALTGTFGTGTDGMTLQQAVFAGLVDPGNLVITREIKDPPLGLASDCGATAPVNCDTAVFLGPRSSYTITPGTGGKITVEQTGPLGAAVGTIPAQKVLDGKDTLTHIEQLKFQDQTVVLGVPSAPTGVSATAGNAQATVSWTGAASDGGSAITSQEIVVSSGGSVVKTVTGLSAAATTSVVTGLTNGTAYTFQVRAVNAFGSGPLSSASAAVTPGGPLTAPTNVVAVRGATGGSVSLSWNAATGGTKPITGYQIQVRILGVVVRTDTIAGTGTTRNVTGLINGITYTFRVRAVTAATLTGAIPAADLGPLSVASNGVTPATVPNAPAILAPNPGAVGGAVTATANWSAPGNNGGSAITNYRVTALRMAADGVTAVGTPTVALAAAGARTLSMTLPAAGNYRFQVVAINAVGDSPASARSALVAAR
jgi:Ca2+-binding RTX toxin-like protein